MPVLFPERNSWRIRWMTSRLTQSSSIGKEYIPHPIPVDNAPRTPILNRRNRYLTHEKYFGLSIFDKPHAQQ